MLYGRTIMHIFLLGLGRITDIRLILNIGTKNLRNIADVYLLKRIFDYIRPDSTNIRYPIGYWKRPDSSNIRYQIRYWKRPESSDIRYPIRYWKRPDIRPNPNFYIDLLSGIFSRISIPSFFSWHSPMSAITHLYTSGWMLG